MFLLNPRKGFTLIEIVFVIALVGLLTALAIPNLLRIRNNTKEGLVKAALRTFSSANESYRAAQVAPIYASTISDLSDGSTPYLDKTWPGDVRHDFNMAYSSNAISYAMIANPLSQNLPYFCIDQSGTLFSSTTAIAASSGCSGGSVVTA